MLKMVDGTGIIGVDMVCPLGGTVSPPQPPNYDKVEMEGVGSLTLLNSLKAPLERLDLIGNSVQLTTTGKNLLNIPFIDGNVSETPIQCNFEKRILIHAETLPKSIQSNVWRIKIVYKDNTLKYVVDSDMQKGSLFDASPENPIVSINYRGLYITEGQYEKIQVEHGVKVTPYEPYTGGKPSPSPDYPQEIKSAGKWNEEKQKYEIDMKVTGKNLFDLTKYDKYDDTWTNTTYTTKKLKLKPNTTYTMSCKRLVDKPKQYVFFLVEEGIASGRGIYVQVTPDLSVNYFISKGTFTTNDTGEITLSYYVDCPKEQYWFTEVIGDIQIEEGNKATPYQPYTEQSVQIALNEPLRGIGEYNDTITKDGVVRKIKRIVFDGSEDEKWGLSREHENHINFALVIKGAITVNTGIRTMMDKFKYFGAIWNSDLLGQDMFGATLRINMPKTLATDLQTFKTWLSQNPLTVDYVLAEPVTELLPESVQAQLQALHSENGTTHVFVDSGEVPCGIKLTYRKEI